MGTQQPEQHVLEPNHINDQEAEAGPDTVLSGSVPPQILRRLFVSHFLSTWNSRTFEMGAVLYIAAIFPGTLLPMSVYALVRSASAVLLSPAVGSWIDQGDRLNVVRVSIVGQRLAVGASCGIFMILHRTKLGRKLKIGLFVISVMLSCVEKLCSVMNLVSVERDWVVVIAPHEAARRLLNARVRRIDLFCKLLGPLVISLINEASTTVAIWVTLAMSCASVVVEYFAIAAVFKLVPALRRSATSTSTDTGNGPERQSSTSGPRSRSMRRTASVLHSVTATILPLKSVPFYFRHPAFAPSFALAMLYFTVLSFSGQMITFLLAVGYSSFHVGLVRAISTIFELSATWAAPKVQRHIGAVRGGLWFLTWQALWLTGGLSWFFANGESITGRQIFAASGLVAAVILSRVGLWGFDLCAQTIVQEEVDEQGRGAFSTVEASLQNLFELLSYLSTIIFSRADQFRWPVVISIVATYAAAGTYAIFVRKRRGHLVHAWDCIKHKPQE